MNRPSASGTSRAAPSPSAATPTPRATTAFRAGPNPAARELLRAVRDLRADLARVRQSEQTAQLDEALADTEDEIDRTGAVGESRRRRVRELLTDAQALTAVLASAATVAGLLGM